MSENKRYTYLDYSKDKYIGSFFCNGVMLKTNEVVDILKEQEERISELEKENKRLKKEIYFLRTEVCDLEMQLEEYE